MLDISSRFFKETDFNSINSFDEIDRQFSPNELLSKGTRLGIIGDRYEIDMLKQSIKEDISVITKIFPKEGGEWIGDVGNSEWKPNPEEIPKRPPGNEDTWEEILDKYDIEGIEFKDGEPDFSVISEGTVEIEDFSTDRNVNFTQADEKLADKWTEEGKDGKEWTPQDIRDYRKEHNLSWHERSDMKTLDLVPQEVHGNIPHSGGISVAKRKENV